MIQRCSAVAFASTARMGTTIVRPFASSPMPSSTTRSWRRKRPSRVATPCASPRART